MDSGFFQIPHWLPSGSGLASFLVHEVQGEFLRAPLPSPTCSLLPRAMAGFAPASRLACRSHAARRTASSSAPSWRTVVRVPTQVRRPLAVLLDGLLKPYIQGIMEVDVGEYR